MGYFARHMNETADADPRHNAADPQLVFTAQPALLAPTCYALPADDPDRVELHSVRGGCCAQERVFGREVEPATG